MRPRVFKQKGSRVYRGRFRVGSNPKIYDVPLHTANKGVAEEKLKQIVLEREREEAGLLAPKLLRDAAQKPILEHLADYIADLTAQTRSKKHVALARNRTSRLCAQCNWKILRDVSSDSFNQWRSTQKLSPKTCNEYLGLASAFLNWLERNGRAPFNPLKTVSKAETRGKERRVRRALSDTELASLVSSSGRRGLFYFVAAFTGLRRGELQALTWLDLHLDAPSPFVLVRASTSKNKTQAALPLVPDLVIALKAFRAQQRIAIGKVFRCGVPTAKTLSEIASI